MIRKISEFKHQLPRAQETAVIDLPAVQQEIDELESQLAAVRSEMRGHLKKLGLAPK